MPEDPDAPAGPKIEVAFAVVPAVARNAAADPLFVLAGGPGQAASQVIGTTMPIFAQLNARRDLVFIDQRGTGRSNRLDCPDSDATLAGRLDPKRQLDDLKRCLRALRSDTRQYATWIAVRDFDAIRQRLGAERINLWGASYGTRAALEYLRQYPQHVRTVVLDGPAPPDMMLPLAFAIDADAALSRLAVTCSADARCNSRYPDFEARIEALVRRARAGFDISVNDPVTGRPQPLHVDLALIASLLRVPLYVPSLAALLPYALAAAAGGGDYGPLVTLSAAVTGRMQENLALGMHFAVVCAEDMPLLSRGRDGAAAQTRFGTTFADLYTEACTNVVDTPGAGRVLPSVALRRPGADPVRRARPGDTTTPWRGTGRAARPRAPCDRALSWPRRQRTGLRTAPDHAVRAHRRHRCARPVLPGEAAGAVILRTGGNHAGCTAGRPAMIEARQLAKSFLARIHGARAHVNAVVDVGFEAPRRRDQRAVRSATVPARRRRCG